MECIEVYEYIQNAIHSVYFIEIGNEASKMREKRGKRSVLGSGVD